MASVDARVDGRTDGRDLGLLAAGENEGAGISLLCSSRWSDIMTEESVSWKANRLI